MRQKIVNSILMLVLLIIPIVYLFLTMLGTQAHEIYYSCEWHATAIAWLDYNQNDEHDTGEPPLEFVQFKYTDALNKNHGPRTVSTGLNGHATLSFSGGGTAETENEIICPEVEFEIQATPPAGYIQTSYSQKKRWGERGESYESFYFGFALDPNASTPIPTSLYSPSAVVPSI